MKPVPLRIEVSPRNVVAVRTAWALRSDPRLKVTLGTIDTPHELPRGRVLRIESGSRVEPILTLLYGEDRHGDDDARAARLGLNAAVFTAGPPGYEWSGRGSPLPARACIGAPDPSRPWVLVAPGVRIDERALESLAGLDKPQLHFLGLSAYSRKLSSVWWLPSPSVVLSLLGRASSVLAPPGPLAWDAARLGVPVIATDAKPRLSPSVVERRLARVVPAALVSDSGFWRVLVGQLVEAHDAAEWGTIAWLLRAREERQAVGLLRGGRLSRKLLKFRRDPRRFWADSCVARHVFDRTPGENVTQRAAVRLRAP